MSLDEALARTFTTDAMVVPYVLYEGDTPLVRQPRLNKSGSEWVVSEGYRICTASFWADLDNPGHGAWTPDLWTAFEEKWANAKSLQTCGVYFGSGGARAIQPLTDILDVAHAERSLAAWIRGLELDGLRPDRACKAWNQNFRLPGALRDGRRYGLGEARLDRMVAIAAPVGVSPVRRRPSTSARVGSVGPVEFSEALPDRWIPARIETLARSVKAVPGEWHSLFLALAGALFDRREPPGDLPAIVHAVSVATGADSRTEDRIRSAQTTVQRAQNGQPYAGYAALRREWPGVADAVDSVTTSAAVSQILRQLAAPAPAVEPMEAAVERVHREIAQPYGVTLLAAPPGTGKTRAVIDHARKLPVIHERAGAGARVALSVPRHDLAAQIAEQIPGRALRIFGPLAHMTGDAPTCIHFEAAAPLVAGGQSLEREFCSGRGDPREACERADGCLARAGQEGPKNANLAIGPHILGGQLSVLAGVAGGMYIDEIPPMVESRRLSQDHIETAVRFLDAFVLRYAVAIRPALLALLAWTRDVGAISEDLTPLTEAVRLGAPSVPAEALAEAGIPADAPPKDLGDLVLVRAAEAINPDARSKAPPLLPISIARCKRSPARAAELGAASSVLDTFWRAITAKNAPLPAVRIDALGDERTMALTRLNDGLVSTLKRQGPVVGMDANAHLHADVWEKVLGVRPKVVRVAVADGAPIARTIIATRNATRSSWLPRGVPAWSAGLLSALRAVIAWASETPCERLALIVPSVVEAAILATIAPEDPKGAAQWKSARMATRGLAEARDLLGPVFAGFRGGIITGHFGAVTGMDHMADCDALATVMDPRPNLGDVRDASAFLGLDPEGRLDVIAAAELQQAHGRLRTVHRTRPGRALHVGGVAPNGWQGLSVDIRELPPGRPRTEAAMEPAEFSAARATLGMSLREFARTLGISHQTAQRWETGVGRGSAIREDVARAVRALVPSGPQTPYTEKDYRGFVDHFPSTPKGGDDREGRPDIDPPLQGVCGPPPATGGLWTTNTPQETP